MTRTPRPPSQMTLPTRSASHSHRNVSHSSAPNGPNSHAIGGV